MATRNSTKNKKILYRRSKIAGLWAEGLTQQKDIAVALKDRYGIVTESGKKEGEAIGQSMVSRDLDALKVEWQEERVAETSEAITAALRRREYLYALALLDYKKSKEPKETTIQEITDDGASMADGKKITTRSKTKSQIKTEERNGDPRYLTVASQQAAAIEKIIGVYAPERREIKLDQQPLLILDRPTNDDDSND